MAVAKPSAPIHLAISKWCPSADTRHPPRRRLCPTVLVALHSSQLLLRHAAAWYALPALFPTPLDPSPALACSILGHHSTLGTVARAQATASPGHSRGGGATAAETSEIQVV